LTTIEKDIAKKGPVSSKNDFEDIYLAVREREQRIYTDDELAVLPRIYPAHAYAKEWRMREHSAQRLINYLCRKRGPLRVLEIGCGNGWLSAMMADVPGTLVTGLDANHIEIDQARRVFKKKNLEFIYDSFTDSTFEEERFDIIVFAASIQYFASIAAVLKQAQSILSGRGEIHVIDTPFYESSDAVDAGIRSNNYYASLGFPQMADHYFHHSLSELWGFKYEVLFDPSGIVNRLFKHDPFYWIKIRN